MWRLSANQSHFGFWCAVGSLTHFFVQVPLHVNVIWWLLMHICILSMIHEGWHSTGLPAAYLGSRGTAWELFFKEAISGTYLLLHPSSCCFPTISSWDSYVSQRDWTICFWRHLAKLSGCDRFQAMTSPVVEEWAMNEALMSRGAVGRLVLAPNEHMSREDLVTNEDVLVPILKHHGLRVTVSQILEHVELFLGYARPKGKANLPRTLFYFIGFLWLSINNWDL